jgi:putative heme degradation protein
MLEDLRRVGPVWNIVRNGHCVLAVQSVYPELTFSPDQRSASACNGERSLDYHLMAWKQAVAFDSECGCGRTYGLEIRNLQGEVGHRICLAKGNNIKPFSEWIQMHQATGLETEESGEGIDARKEEPFLSLPAILPPGTLEFSPELLRTVLITAAQREIQLIATVASEGISQTARLDVQRASEAHGWLVLSGRQRSLYVESQPTGTLYLEPGQLEGESLWRLSLTDGKNHRLLRLQAGVDSRSAWNQLVREIILSSPGPEV